MEKLAIAAHQNVKEREFWVNRLSDNFEKSVFPYDYNHERTNRKEYDLPVDDSAKFQFTGILFSQLMKLSKASDDSLNLILVTGVILLLAMYTNRQDIMVGAPIFKQEMDTEFINTILPLRTRFRKDITVKELLVQVRKTIIDAVANQNYPMEILLKELNTSFSEGEFPLFDVAILLENIQERRYLQPVRINMIFSFERRENHIEGEVEFNPLLYKRSTIDRIVKHLSRLLQEMVLNPQQPVSGIDLLSEAEQRQLLYDSNDNRTEYPANQTLHQLFEQQVEKNPSQIALIYGAQRLTYGELNERANRLARFLRRKGIHSDGIVGIMMERSLEMIVTIMAVLKSGGAYLPIDPETPERRIITMLEDGNVSILLTNTANAANYSFTNLQERQIIGWKPLKTLVRPQIKDLDSLPIPDRSLINYETYSRYIGQGMLKYSINLQATRGCPYDCKYCCRVWPRRNVSRSAENIFNEVKFYYDMGIKRFVFIDDIFNLDIQNSRKFFDLIIQNSLKVQMVFPSGLRGDILTKDYIDRMIEAGVVSFPLALETASPRLQKLIGKNLNIEKLHKNVEYIIKKYPNVILELHTMHGFPTETEKEAMTTLDFIKSMKWLHFPYIHILRIFSNTEMEKLALENGISKESILRSRNLAYHELPDTLPFDRSFTLKYQTDFLNDYFLSRERLLSVLPHQMNLLTEDEMVQKYNSYLPVDINHFADLLEFVGITPKELEAKECLEDNGIGVPNINEKMLECFLVKKSSEDALKVLLLDLSQVFSSESNLIYDVVEQPLGLMYLMSYLNHQFGDRISGRIVKSRIDFDSFVELKDLLKQFQPDIIGIRSLTYYMDLFHQTVALIRLWGFNVPIVAGGPYVTSNYETILQDQNVDLAVLGEGEHTFGELIGKMIENRKQLPDETVLREIKGIAFVSGRNGKEFSREIFLLDQLEETLANESPENLGTVNSSNNLAYIIFTSGSTGKPKGILTTHRNAVRVVRDTNYIHLKEEDRILQLSNYAFDGSIFDIYGALLNGAVLVLIPQRDVFSVDVLSDLIRNEKISVFFVTTALFNTLVDLKMHYLEGVRNVLFGGERVSVEHSRKALEYLGKSRIIHVYGPTETTVYATYYFIDGIHPMAPTIPIGKPIANTSAYILDKELKPVPPGVYGTIYIGGEGVARGYMNNIELTAERFIPHPFDAGERLYNSGDLGRWLPDGNIEFLGRADHQVKIRGFRIELEEIESQLLRLEGINKAVVAVWEDGNHDKYICAYIVSQEELDLSRLRDHLSTELPHYLIPSYFVRLAELPLTSNGKIDRKALPSPELKRGEEYVPPRGIIEKKLVEIWAGILGIEQDVIGIDTDFFEIGGRSLKATIMTARIHQTFNVKLPLVEVFKAPTIRELAKYIKETVRDKHISIEPVEEKEYYRLSCAQKRLYILHQMAPENIVYNMPGIIHFEKIEKKPDIETLENTFGKLIKRHESFRTSFCMVEDEPLQKVHENLEFAVEYYDLQSSGKLEKAVQNFVRPFDLGQAPLLRVGLISTKPGEHFLIVDMHHIISDGISHEIMVKDFCALYKGRELSPLRFRYRDYAEWQYSETQKEMKKKQEAYWLKEFEKEIPLLNLPTDFPRPDVIGFKGSSVILELDDTTTRKIREYASQMGVTLMMYLLSVYKILLSGYSGQEDIVVGTVIAGRRHVDLENIIGFFVNMLAIRTLPAKDKRFSDYLAEIKEKAVNAFENQEYQFEELVSKLAIRRQPGRHPLVDAVFVFQDESHVTPESQKDNAADLVSKRYKVSHFDLMLHATEKGDSLMIAFEYSTDLFKKSTIEEFSHFYVKILEQVLEDQNIKLEEIEIDLNLLTAKSDILQDDPEDWDL
jgi:amino acid adenylation domain-containing protein